MFTRPHHAVVRFGAELRLHTVRIRDQSPGSHRYCELQLFLPIATITVLGPAWQSPPMYIVRAMRRLQIFIESLEIGAIRFHTELFEGADSIDWPTAARMMSASMR